ncbi:hypothetical protein [Hamadaea tsunoensis]|uniref:hypothetical protein n=1 Tax=Hamadaea tsunoensis TaxID=53368 RepID=UPI0003FE91E1|nr:hypothetical protein [Hamadaea tsunoensis]
MIARYREAVADLLLDLAPHAASGDHHKIDIVARDRVEDTAELAIVLTATPGGALAALDRLATEVHAYQPNRRSSAADLLAFLRIWWYAQIDAAWWGDVRPYATDDEIATAAELTDIAPLRARGIVHYRRQPRTYAGRAVRAVARRALPDHTPRTSGLLSTRTRMEVAELVEQMAAAFTRPLWVTSLTRSLEHQQRLKSLGYAALSPSAHCTGYAADLEMAWYARLGVAGELAAVLRERQAAGDLNVIDEGQAWHVCVSPDAAAALAGGKAGA